MKEEVSNDCRDWEIEDRQEETLAWEKGVQELDLGYRRRNKIIYKELHKLETTYKDLEKREEKLRWSLTIHPNKEYDRWLTGRDLKRVLKCFH